MRWCVALLVASAAQSDTPVADRSRRVEAVRIEQPIHLDGALDEAEWRLAEPAADFLQQQPDEGKPATHRSEVRFLYDATTLYIGAMLYDEQPDKLIVNELKRDFPGRDGDMFGIVLDTFRDRRSAYGFLTNPGGAQRESQAYDNGRRNDASWDGIWYVRTAILENGWTVEAAIPFKTLRFPQAEAQEWGLNLVRIIRRLNEDTTWSFVPRQFTHYNVAYAGVLSGIRFVQPGRNLRLKPFATAQAGRGLASERDWDADGGADLKWGITSSLVLDATYRTDFSQVEADEQQINLTRFSLFFPEKREFFLESPASFQIGLADRDQRGRRDLIPFFSRRIGLSSTGQPIPVFGGLRLTGRAGRNGVGLLNMQTEAIDGRPGDNFTAVRLSRELSPWAAVGGFYFGRESEASHNRVGGLDLRLSPTRTLEIEAFALTSMTSQASSDGVRDVAGRAGLRLDANRHRARLGYFHVGDRFQNDLGFVQRRGVGAIFSEYTRVFRPLVTYRRVREYSVGGALEVVGDDRYTEVLTRIGRVTGGIEFADGGQLSASYSGSFERLTAPFAIRRDVVIPPGDYRFADVSLEFESDKSKAVSGAADLSTGGFWTGSRTSVGGSVRLRWSAHLATTAGFTRASVRLPEGSFVTGVAALRVDASITTRMFVNAFVQYNGDTRTWFSNVRFNFIHRPLSDIYVVWNVTRSPGLDLSSVIFKYTHAIAF